MGTDVGLMSLLSFSLHLLSSFCWVNQLTHIQLWAKEVWGIQKRKLHKPLLPTKPWKITEFCRWGPQYKTASAAVDSYLHVHSDIFLFTAFWICISLTLFDYAHTSTCFNTICSFVVTPDGKSAKLIMGPAHRCFVTWGIHCFTELL